MKNLNRLGRICTERRCFFIIMVTREWYQLMFCGRKDVIVYDAESHACIMDGFRMAPGHSYVLNIMTWKILKNKWACY